MNSTACSPKIIIPDLYNRSSAVVYVIPQLANNLYNRSSVVDSSFYNQPQVGKPTWGYNYPTALRRLPLPSATIPKNALSHRPPSPKPAIINGLRQRRNAKKTAEERL